MDDVKNYAKENGLMPPPPPPVPPVQKMSPPPVPPVQKMSPPPVPPVAVLKESPVPPLPPVQKMSPPPVPPVAMMKEPPVPPVPPVQKMSPPPVPPVAMMKESPVPPVPPVAMMKESPVPPVPPVAMMKESPVPPVPPVAMMKEPPVPPVPPVAMMKEPPVPPVPPVQKMSPPPVPPVAVMNPPPISSNSDSKIKIPENLKKVSKEMGKKLEGIDKEKVGDTTTKVLNILSKIYIFDFLRRLFKKNNLGTIIFLVLNIGLYIGLFGGYQMPEMIPTAIALYLLSLCIALSPIGEFILRIQSGCKRLKKVKNKKNAERLQFLFNEVYEKAREKDPSISTKVKIFMSKDKDINAFATGRKTVCATTGLMQLSDEEIKGILAHECGHIAHKDTDLLLVILVSNMLLSVLFVVLRVVVWMVIFLVGEGERSLAGIGNLIARIFVDFLLVMLIRLWTKLGIFLVMHSSRMNEFEADKFACELGLGSQLAYALNHIDGDGEKKGFWSNLRSSHPDTIDRVEKINEWMKQNDGRSNVQIQGTTVVREPSRQPMGMAAAVPPVSQPERLHPPFNIIPFVRSEYLQQNQYGYGRFSEDGRMYYGQVLNVQNGYYDFLFFDQVREWIPENCVVSVKDAWTQLKASGNQQYQGLYYPCSIVGSTPEGRAIVQYNDQTQEVIGMDAFMFICPPNL